MKRRGFLKLLGIGAAASPAVADQVIEEFKKPLRPHTGFTQMPLHSKEDVRPLVEVLSEGNEVLDDAHFLDSYVYKNTHKHTVRTGIPSVTWRKINVNLKK